MRVASAIAFVLFVLAAAVQVNDPDPLIWIFAYGVAAATAAAAFFGTISTPLSLGLGAAYLVASWRTWPLGDGGLSLGLESFGMSSLHVEEVREALGLAICAGWMIFLAIRRWVRPSLLIVLVATCLGLGCSTHLTRSGVRNDAGPIQVPESLESRPIPRERVAMGLENPRGMLPRGDRQLLVSVAGNGDPARPPDGALLLLDDLDGDGVFAGAGERRSLLAGQPSRNIVDIVRRDEVFGMAGIAQGGGTTLASLAYFGGPSTIYRVDGDEVSEWSRVFGNINDLAYDPRHDAWFAVSSSSDEIVRLQPERGSTRVVKVPPLAGGQDAVPGYLRYDPRSGDLLVTLFSGSTEGEEGGVGTELEPGAGGVVQVDPDTGELRWIVTGLTAPTDLEIGPDGRLYVLEFCSGFQDPITERPAMWRGPSHGGFRRFSGRLLAIDRDRGEVVVVADRLDGPTNLALRDRELYIAQGMGTPGRPIPGPDGTVPLTGFIERMELPATRKAG